jgi:two-component system, cell cycle sensor histidine kinase and response regulator CckA
MLFEYVSIGYFVINPILALIIVSRFHKTPLAKLYAFCVLGMIVLGVVGYLLDARLGSTIEHILGPISVFLTSLTPFFFLHFAMMLIGRHDIVSSKSTVFAIYGTGLFCYTLVLLGYIPNPISIERGITASGYVFYVTWMSIYFGMGIALLNTISQGFEDRKPRSGVLLIGLSVLILFLPGPFTESTFFTALHLSVETYFITSTLALTFAIYLVFRYRVMMNTPYEALKTILKVMNDILFKMDDSLRIELVRGALTDQLGFTEKELVGKSFQVLIEEKDLMDAYLDYAFHGKVTESYFDTDVVCKDGRKAAMAFSLTPVVENDEITGFVAVGRNISARREAEKALIQAHHDLEMRVRERTAQLRETNEVLQAEVAERKRSQEALLQQQSYFRQLFENSPAGIVILDEKDTILNANSAFLQMFQFTHEEVIGQNTNDLIVPAHLIEDAKKLSALCLEGRAIQKETTRRRKDKTLMEVGITGYPIVIENSLVGVYGMYTDITERKKLEDKLRESQKLESLGTLAGGIAHDFNNILAIILGYASRIDRTDVDPASLSLSIDAITKATQRGASVVSQLLTFARKSDITFERISVNDQIKDIVKLVRETFSKSISVVSELQKNLPEVKADPTQIHQVLLNLCLNARDAMPDGGVLKLRSRIAKGDMLRLRLPKATANEYIAVDVSDTGIGMDEATRGRIFEPFFTTKEFGKGTGLGLAVVFGIMESHDGFVDVESEPGKGTTMSLYFPVNRESHDILDFKRGHSAKTPGGTETILFVEDEILISELTKSDLSSKGYTVLTALDGNDAVEIYANQYKAIDLVICDLGLPGLMGYDVLRKMKRINPEIKFILASGYLEQVQKAAIFELGAKDILQKPYEFDKMLRSVREVLDAKKG